MDKHITNIKDLVIKFMANEKEMEAKAKEGDAVSCFQMGVVQMLGVNTPVDFKKACLFLNNESLANNDDANRLLGFIAECESKYSEAFQAYAKTAHVKNASYMAKVIEGRNGLLKFLRAKEFPTAINKTISLILAGYAEGGTSKIEACMKIATICDDERSCLDASECLYESGYFISACQWLNKGGIKPNDPLYVSITDKYRESKENLKSSKAVQIIEIEDASLLKKDDFTDSLVQVRDNCIQASHETKQVWEVQARNLVEPIIRKLKNDEKEASLAQKAKEEAARKRKIVFILLGVIAVAALFFFLISTNRTPSNKTSDYSESISEEPVITGGDNAQSQDMIRSGMQEYGKNEDVSRPEGKEIDYRDYDKILSERKLSASDMEGKSAKELEIMRNSVYARYGYKFKREDLLDYFSQYSWYRPTTSDMESIYKMMNDAEKYNVEFIKKYE